GLGSWERSVKLPVRYTYGSKQAILNFAFSLWSARVFVTALEAAAEQAVAAPDAAEAVAFRLLRGLLRLSGSDRSTIEYSRSVRPFVSTPGCDLSPLARESAAGPRRALQP